MKNDRAYYRVREHKHRGYALLNDIFSKQELQRQRVLHSLAFLALLTLSIIGLTSFALTTFGVITLGPAVTYTMGLATGMSMWRAGKRMGMFQHVDAAYQHGGTED